MYPFVYILCVAAYTLQRQSSIVTAQTVWSAKARIFTIDLLLKICCS